MINTSQTYKQLFNERAIHDYRLLVDDVAYTHEDIKDSIVLQQNLFDKSTFTVGSFTIGVLKLKLTVPSDEIPHNASVVFSYRYNNGETQSEWIDKFKGNITRRTIHGDALTEIEVKDKASNYDKFLDYFGESLSKYPANTRKVANLCASHLGLEIDNIEDVINLDIVEYPNENTMVEMLKEIATNSGGNWVIVGDKLRLVTKGKNYHTFIKYADDDQGNGMSENEDGKEYYGIYYGLSDSGNKDDYAWYEMPSDRNLIKWTDSFDGFSFYSDTAGNRGKFLIKDNVLTLLPEQNGNSYWTFEFEDNINLEQNETYTLSFDIKSDDNTTIGVYWHPSENYTRWRIKPEETWTRVSFTYTQSGATIKKPVKGIRHLMGLHLLNKNKKYSIKKIKLEKGNQATPWTPAISETKVDFPAQSIETSSLLNPISKILMYYADESVFESGNDNGSTIEIDSKWATQDSTDYVHSVLNGYEYKPIKVTNGYIDPTLELGDIIFVDDNEVLLANVKWVFDGIVTADIEVPINNEINYDDPYNTLVNNQFKRKVSLGDAYQGVTISRDKGIEMLVSPDGTEENAIGRYYADIYRGIAFQTRDNKNQDWHDWLYFDIDEKKFKLMLDGDEELNEKITSIDVNLDGINAQVQNIHSGNIIPNLNGEFGYMSWLGDGELLHYDDLVYHDDLMYTHTFVPKLMDNSMSQWGISFYGTNTTGKGYIIPDTYYSFRAKVHKYKPFDVDVLEYDENQDLIGTTTFNFRQPQTYVTFKITPKENTYNIALKFKPIDVSIDDRLELTEMMFNRGEPKEWFEGTMDVKLYAESRVSMLDDKILLESQRVDGLNNDIHNAGVEINAVDGITTYGKHFRVMDSDRTKSLLEVVTVAGEEQLLIDINKGSVGNFSIKDGVMEFTTPEYNREYTQSDLAYVKNLIMDNVQKTSEDVLMYDLNGDGDVTAVDYMMIRSYLNGERDLEKVIKTNIKVGTSDGKIVVTSLYKTEEEGFVQGDRVIIGGNEVKARNLSANSIYADTLALKGKAIKIDSNGFLKATTDV